MNNFIVIKLALAGGLFLIGFLGALSAQCVRGNWPNLVLLSNSVAAGVLVGVAVVHMLSDNQASLEDWGLALNTKLTGCDLPSSTDSTRRLTDACEPFPIGYALFVVGLFLIVAIEYGGGPHEDGTEVTQKTATAVEPSSDSEDSSLDSINLVERRRRANSGSTVTGVSTAAGVSVHSIIESIAMGSSNNLASFTSLLFAVALHKGFTSFAVGSALSASENRCVYLSGAIAYSMASPTGIVLGILLTSFNDNLCAAAQCFAAGTLMAIGLLDLLLPAVVIEDKCQARWNILAAFLSASAMTTLAAWI